MRYTRGVNTIARFGIQLSNIPEPVINTITNQRGVGSGLFVQEPAPAEIFGKLNVFRGSLAGLEGIFRERKCHNCALLLMQLPGIESTAEMDALLV